MNQEELVLGAESAIMWSVFYIDFVFPAMENVKTLFIFLCLKYCKLINLDLRVEFLCFS